MSVPKDRWIVAWVDSYWRDDDDPLCIRWDETAGWGEAGAFSADARDMDENMLWFSEDEIVAWAECPARPVTD